MHNIRPANDDLRILFHRNDPTPIKANHSGRASSRVPDVVLVSLAVAQDATKDVDMDMQWSDAVTHLAPKHPLKKFGWTQILCSLEFKLTAKQLKLPPITYSRFGDVCSPKANVLERFNPDSETPGMVHAEAAKVRPTSASACLSSKKSRAASTKSYPGSEKPRATRENLNSFPGELSGFTIAASADSHRQRTPPVVVSQRIEPRAANRHSKSKKSKSKRKPGTRCRLLSFNAVCMASRCSHERHA